RALSHGGHRNVAGAPTSAYSILPGRRERPPGPPPPRPPNQEDSMRKTFALAAVAALAVSGAAFAQRDQIRMVGSSPFYPFATKVAEQFGHTSGFKTPVIESTGTGGGLKLFCAGAGLDTPDISNASRRIKPSE